MRGTAQSEETEPQEKRTALGAVGAPVLDNPALFGRLGEGLLGVSVACKTPQDSTIAGHPKNQP